MFSTILGYRYSDSCMFAKAIIAMCIAFTFVFAGSTTAALQPANWNGGGGNWSDASKWSTNPLVPINGNGGNTYNPSINNGSVTLDTNVEVEGLLVGHHPYVADLTVPSGFTLTTNEGATIGDAYTLPGFQEYGTGTVTVIGPSAHWINLGGFVTLGKSYGTGNLIIKSGGVVTSNNLGVARTFNGTLGSGLVSVTGAGSALSVNGLMQIGDTGGYGKLIIDTNATVSATEIQFGPNDVLEVSTGATPTAAAPITAHGALMLSGAFHMKFAAKPMVGHYPLLAYKSVAGHFLSVMVDNISAAEYSIDYGSGTNGIVSLNVNPLLQGDYNNNGVVDAADYTVWRDSLGASVGPYLGADGNGNGVIDAGDYDVWKMHFGEHTVGSSAAAANSVLGSIPEPVTAVLAVLGTALFGLTRMCIRPLRSRCKGVTQSLIFPLWAGIVVLTATTIADGVEIERAESRTWTDRTGRFSVEAKLQSLEDGTVTLLRPDRRIIHVPIETLSVSDQQYARDAFNPKTVAEDSIVAGSDGQQPVAKSLPSFALILPAGIKVNEGKLYLRLLLAVNKPLADKANGGEQLAPDEKLKPVVIVHADHLADARRADVLLRLSFDKIKITKDTPEHYKIKDAETGQVVGPRFATVHLDGSYVVERRRLEDGEVVSSTSDKFTEERSNYKYKDDGLSNLVQYEVRGIKNVAAAHRKVEYERISANALEDEMIQDLVVRIVEGHGEMMSFQFEAPVSPHRVP